MNFGPRYYDDSEWRIRVEDSLRDNLQKTISILKIYANDFDKGEPARKLLRELGEATIGNGSVATKASDALKF
ncbi:MAG: hypothetical protein OEU36_09485 [Gammaproteobacteria bacterium]|nr:hypothetical protein [Gammaproteobacteria bacterium]